ncbi:MAG: CHRD domain-containing protein, partial [Chromatiales bacterium]
MKTIILSVILGLALAGNSYAGRPMQFKTHLQGFDLNGNPITTNATGEAMVAVLDDGTALGFKVSVAGITNLWMAHIHVAPEPVEVTDPSGPVAFWFTG